MARRKTAKPFKEAEAYLVQSAALAQLGDTVISMVKL